jgi:hypothetical protein
MSTRGRGDGAESAGTTTGDGRPALRVARVPDEAGRGVGAGISERPRRVSRARTCRTSGDQRIRARAPLRGCELLRLPRGPAASAERATPCSTRACKLPNAPGVPSRPPRTTCTPTSPPRIFSHSVAAARARVDPSSSATTVPDDEPGAPGSGTSPLAQARAPPAWCRIDRGSASCPRCGCRLRDGASRPAGPGLGPPSRTNLATPQPIARSPTTSTNLRTAERRS